MAGARRSSETRITASIFGTMLMVCSCTDVRAWNRLTATPTTMPTRSTGPARTSDVTSSSRARSTTCRSRSCIGLVNDEGGDEGLADEMPAVDEDEHEDLERRRDHHGRQHEHAHRDQDARDDEVDHEERQEQEEAHLEGRLELGEHEGRHHDLERQVLGLERRAAFDGLDLGQVGEQLELARARVGEQEGAQLPPSGLQRLLAAELVRLVRDVGLARSEEHTSELQSLRHLVCRLLLEKKKKKKNIRLNI